MTGPAAPAASPAEPSPAAYAPPAAADGASFAPAGPERPDDSAAAAPAAGASPLDVPRDTTPTFELEMLVSGAVLFGLFQIPPLLRELAERWDANAGLVGRFFVTSMGLIGGAAVYALIGCFVVHLVLRGYWVALVGVDSVFPGGVRWDRMREYGPIQTELQRTRVRPLREFIERADNTATLVFASGFVLTASTLTSFVFLTVVGGTLAVSARFFGTIGGVIAVAVCSSVLAGAVWVAFGLDYTRGARLDPHGRAARAIRRVMIASNSSMPVGMRSMAAVLSTNVEKRVVFGALTVGMLASMAMSFVNTTRDDGSLPSPGAFPFFSDDAPQSLSATSYANLRGQADANRRAPWVDADVAVGPYVRLYIPYRPQVHDEALARECPGLRPLDADDPFAPAARAAADSVLACAARVHRIALDGRPVAGLRFHYFADPRANRRVFVAYLPTAGLPSGEHTITVWPARANDAKSPNRPYEITVWR